MAEIKKIVPVSSKETVKEEKKDSKPAAAKATTPKKAAPKAEAKKAAPKTTTTKSAPKTVAAKAAPKKAAPKVATKEEPKAVSPDGSLADIAEEQFDATTSKIISALSALNSQLDKARAKGSIRGKEIVHGFGGEGKFAELIEDLAGYMGEATAAGVTIGSTPIVVMAGTAKGIYKKITE